MDTLEGEMDAVQTKNAEQDTAISNGEVTGLTISDGSSSGTFKVTASKGSGDVVSNEFTVPASRIYGGYTHSASPEGFCSLGFDSVNTSAYPATEVTGYYVTYLPAMPIVAGINTITLVLHGIGSEYTTLDTTSVATYGSTRTITAKSSAVISGGISLDDSSTKIRLQPGTYRANCIALPSPNSGYVFSTIPRIKISVNGSGKITSAIFIGTAGIYTTSTPSSIYLYFGIDFTTLEKVS